MGKKIFIGIGIILIIALIGGYFIFSGSSPDNSNENQSSGLFSGSKTSSEDVSKMVLEVSELPEGYEIAERNLRLESDVSERGLNWGWKEGYYIRYLKGESLIDTSRIEIYISRYPLENVSNFLKRADDELEGYTIEELPDPSIGEGSKSTRYTDNEMGLREYRIEFYKKDIYVSINNGGARTNYEVLKELAKKIGEKI